MKGLKNSPKKFLSESIMKRNRAPFGVKPNEDNVSEKSTESPYEFKENSEILPDGAERGTKKYQRETKIKECLKTLNSRLAGKGPEVRNMGQLMAELSLEYLNHETNIQALTGCIEKLQKDASIAEVQRGDMDEALTEARNHLAEAAAFKSEITELKEGMSSVKCTIDRLLKDADIATEQREELDKNKEQTKRG